MTLYRGLCLDDGQGFQEGMIFCFIVCHITDVFMLYRKGGARLLLVENNDPRDSRLSPLLVSKALTVNVEDWQVTSTPKLERPFEQAHDIGSYIGFDALRDQTRTAGPTLSSSDLCSSVNHVRIR